MTKDKVLALLLQNVDRELSGEEIARTLSISRTAVWKAVETLRQEGYAIDSAPRRGYCLSSKSDVLSEQGVRQYLQNPRIEPRVYERICSTNTVLKAMASGGAPEGLALIAAEQKQGHGRMGRSFYSPKDTGLYLSLLLRPTAPATEAVGLTACAAVAVCEAIEELSGRQTQIKWVNDVLVDGKKVCGILSEASLDCENGHLAFAVVGVGINIAEPEGGFPPELREIAGAAFGEERPPALRCRLAARLLDKLMDYCARPGDEALYEAYLRRSTVLGKDINLLSPDGVPAPAFALAIERDYGLLVRLADGSLRKLRAGEVSVRTGE